MKRGGTKMHCRACGYVTVCASIPFEGRDQIGYLYELGLYYFSRLRECQECGGKFQTVEINSLWLDEVDSEISRVKNELNDKFEKAVGANETIRSWTTDLDLKIKSIERNLEELKALNEKINLATERNRFFKAQRN
jgi:hypothetical protein